ncbi:helix-hairpin-helix domain-containing protein [Curtobacterium sp. MCBA15_001]|uniref:helix-hairpin-helix domain-containing protein n=1 Tax=Curtobacterium sp. MCBA15_001 TaxID=1898731 RepID=UPI0008DE1D30|nr:helix-hairpin-helix domain-containing protein [Curtobacterium sp. MCBA15_001]OIH96292.1 hypothetical protein BIU90_00650 [Curtobacterium sp. MCBA15_001]
MSRFTLTPRAAILLAVLVVVVALVVIVVGARGGDGGGDSGAVSVSGAAPVGPGRPTASASDGGGGATGAPSASGSPSASGAPVVVHVVGAVGAPGLITLGSGARVADALDRAGGAAADADLARVNLARPVVDGERLYVPRVGETDIPATVDGGDPGANGGASGTGASGSGPGAGPDGVPPVVDLNTADQATLETLPGIGPALAQRILAWRQEHGRFAAPQDLLEVSGIGESRFAELESRVRV